MTETQVNKAEIAKNLEAMLRTGFDEAVKQGNPEIASKAYIDAEILALTNGTGTPNYDAVKTRFRQEIGQIDEVLKKISKAGILNSVEEIKELKKVYNQPLLVYITANKELKPKAREKSEQEREAERVNGFYNDLIEDLVKEEEQ
ncbi:MAG TPA: hypothetical protein VJB94_01035 [Candidatus Nanoarchaeia archaeon]|nr:hypothetical protein [Candidatus Nanoarchaeia archaeon]